MNRYLSIQKILLALNVSTLLAYRANFINSLISSLLWGGMSILMMSLLSYGSQSVYGWKHNDLLLMIGVYNILIAIFHMLFSKNFQRFSQIVHLGELDHLLLKPIDSQYLVSFWITNFTSFFRLILGIGYTAMIVSWLHISLTVWDLLFFSFLIICGLTFLYSLWFVIITLTIWYTRLSNLVELLYEINGVSRFPSEMFKELGTFVFIIFLPLTLVINAPTKILLKQSNGVLISELFVATVSLFLFSRWFWKFALQHYSSASS